MIEKEAYLYTREFIFIVEYISYKIKELANDWTSGKSTHFYAHQISKALSAPQVGI